jgi:tetratricopeptide (TPR) repeat protein
MCASQQKRIERARSQDPQYQYNLGLFYLNNGNIDQAIEAFKRTLSLNPQYFLAFNGLGLAHSMKGNLEEAVKHYLKCLEVNPQFTDTHNNLGILYLEMGFIDKAEEEFLKVILDRNYRSRGSPYYNLARLYFTQGKYKEALNYIEKSIVENQNFADAFNLQGLILEKLDNSLDAIDSYRKAIKIFPDEINFNFNLAVALFNNNEFSEARVLLEKQQLQVTDPDLKLKIDQYLKKIK